MVAGEQVAQGIDANPEAVRVEIRMPADVLCVGAVFRMHLAHLAEHQTSRSSAAHQVSTLAVGFSANRDLCHERSTGVFEILRQSARWTCAEIV